MAKLRIDVWSDIACPWCYVGKRRLEAALAQFPHRDQVTLVWRAFELDPSAPRIREGGGSYAARIAKKYGTPVAVAEARMRQMTEIAAADGLDFRFDRIQPGNTFDAHRLLHLAHERGVQDAVKERFLRAYLTEGAAIGDPETLSRLAREAGLDTDEVSSVLATDTYTREVRADEEEAQSLGISGVPFFVLGGRHAVSGAQPAALLLGGLGKAWSEVAAAGEPAFAEGAACGPDGCV
jgi:predicted DsbA family dithiol-disulfide isomerase